MKFAFVLVALAAAGSTAPASLWAMRGRDDNWAAVDRNRDGRISPEEFTVLRRR